MLSYVYLQLPKCFFFNLYVFSLHHLIQRTDAYQFNSIPCKEQTLPVRSLNAFSTSGLCNFMVFFNLNGILPR